MSAMFELAGGGIDVAPEPGDNPGNHAVTQHEAGTGISFEVLDVVNAGDNAGVRTEIDDAFVNEWESPYLDPGQSAAGYVGLGRLSEGRDTVLIYVNPGSGQSDHGVNALDAG